ncbi:helix-turn-helix domain-containing protein [Leifsonia sp. 2TAF2]|uniref:helix-turn-helix domain-containing protein n=1 Tax=Leifsonia sp. 2TAF2 TaxID=3233009 RepID=UPI003F955104
MKNPVAPAAQMLGERVRRARIHLGLSQEAIAGLASMHVTNYGKIERGDANPSLLTIVRIAAVLGTSVAALTEEITREHLPTGMRVLPAREYLIERERRLRRSR